MEAIPLLTPAMSLVERAQQVSLVERAQQVSLEEHPRKRNFPLLLRTIAVDMWNSNRRSGTYSFNRVYQYTGVYTDADDETSAWLWEQLKTLCADATTGCKFAPCHKGITVDLRKLIDHLSATGAWPEWILMELMDPNAPWDRKKAGNKLYDGA